MRNNNGKDTRNVNPNTNPIKIIVLGAGQRGAEAYAPYALDNPQDVQIVGVAEPRDDRRERFAQTFSLPEENVYASWQELLERERFADAVIVATQDKEHYAPVMKALEKGYHVLCEKPMSPDPAECIRMAQAAKKYDRKLSVCHVLRYTPFFTQIKKLIDAGTIGEVMGITLTENVAYWHQAHSYVRGNWRNSKESSPMILAKSCHDLDILLWLIGDKCTQVSSYGHLTHFRLENAPEGAPERCLDGCPHRNECPYYAPHIYIEWKDAWQAAVIRKVVSLDTSPAGLTNALRTGPYGRCVYHCDNDVVDHQVVNLDFQKGATAAFTMTAFANDEGRVIKVMGTRGEITGEAANDIICYVTYLDQTRHTIKVHPAGGHMGGDAGIMQDFVRMLREHDAGGGRTSAEKSVESHLLALAAEKSRVEGRNIRMDEYEAALKQNG